MAEANLISGLHIGMLSTPMLADARTAQDFEGLMQPVRVAGLEVIAIAYKASFGSPSSTELP